MREAFRFVVALAGLAILPAPALSAEKVGEVTLARTTITGDGGRLQVKSPVHRDERIRTSGTGLGEFVFRDGTRFAVGWNSSVVIDEFVFSDSGTAKKVTVKAAKGTFRWISGHSRSSAYSISTPAGTLGIRGTAFDFYVGPGGKTAVVLMSGSARFCGSNGCQDLRRRCDSVVATPRGGVSETRRVSRNIFNTLGTSRALPFQSGNQRLSRRFDTGGSCLSAASLLEPQRRAPVPTRAAPPPPPPRITPPPPAPPPRADRPTPERPAPERPTKTKNPNNGRGNGSGDGSPGGNAGNDGDSGPSPGQSGNNGNNGKGNNGRGKGKGTL
jgi:hypothetical protein